ncbi:CDF family Co(II)/Ni(II) efflux transporter DmeF [Azohydromonas sp. G-1-1-14]|uniref:CDF family Co(II)/Ni(II) efflux transporter DmeF n=2 Tax=Azohydromonas caseinilytica TaxID=2728836 RepID=A0A848FBI6_9BURK|nr:CDF family Co(II)/Ni(II) efflux transporter DmeF [Azohydromonas caseinilytica]
MQHSHDLTPFHHSHDWQDAGAEGRARALRAVTILTLLTMVVELAAGAWSGSLALLADGWHMGTHALALGGALLAAQLAQRAQRSERYAFGGWKIEVLAAYTSGLMLLAVSAWLVVDAVRVLLDPHPIAYGEAMAVALIGLAVNLGSAWLLHRGAHGHGDEHEDDHDHGYHHGPHHDHDHAHGHAHGHGHSHGAGHHDHNFNAAYLHVVADALTSVLAIAALAGGWRYGWRWLDPLVAVLGAVVISRWAVGVLKVSAHALVDATASTELRAQVRQAIESDGDAQLADLHVWQVGPQAWSVVASVVADKPLEPAQYRRRLEHLHTLQHVTVEVHQCRGAA